MESGVFTLKTLKRAFDEAAENVCAQTASHFQGCARVQLDSLIIKLDLDAVSEDQFELSNPDSINAIHVEYSHNGKGQSDLQIEPLDRGKADV